VIRVKYDVQAFQKTRYGGIATYFIELREHVNELYRGTYEIVLDGILTSNPNLETEKFFPLLFRSRSISVLARIVNPRVSMIRNFDIVHSTYYLKEFLPKIPRERHVVTIHDMIPEDYPQFFDGGNPHKAKKDYVDKSSVIICVSHYTKSRLIEHYPWIDEQEIFVVHHASKFSITANDIDLIRQERFTNNHGNRILYVGARNGYKNFQVLLKAAKLIVEDGDSLEIFCAGGGPLTLNEKNLIKDAGLEDMVRQLNVNDEQLRELYLSSICQVTTSIVEGFGLPLLEAMSLGCPTIVTTAEALLEVSKGNSLIFEPNSHVELASLIGQIIRSPGLRDELSHRGYRRSLDFSWAISAEKTLSAYSAVLEKCC